MKVTDEMVDRFLSWRLPITAMPDACVMDRSHDRMGTHVLSFTEAKAMLEHVLAGCDESKSGGLIPPFGWWDRTNGCMYFRVDDAVRAEDGGNTLIPLYRHAPDEPHKPGPIADPRGIVSTTNITLPPSAGSSES